MKLTYDRKQIKGCLGLGVRAGHGWGIRELYWVLKMFYTLTVVWLDTPHVKLINMYTLNECIDLYVNYIPQ